MGGPWVVQEGYLLYKQDDVASVHPSSPRAAANATAAAAGGAAPNAQLLLHPFKNGLLPAHMGSSSSSSSKLLVERYFVLYMNRKLEIYDSNLEDTRRKIGETRYVSAFAGWDGNGLLKVGESYGLEVKVDSKPNSSGRHTTSMFVAAFNRLDLEKWCRGLVAVLDPQSAAGEEVRRERRRVRKEEKRLEAEREEKIRKWREMKVKHAEDERLRLLAREEEINNMTPLERVDGLGSLDDDTAKMLEKRKLRLQRRQAPTMGRVNKAAYRKRMEEGAGGKLENVQPLQTRIVESKSRVRVELPLPGQFIEAAGSTPHRHGHPSSKDRTRLGSSSSESSLENPSDSSSVSSNSLLSSGHSGSSSSHMKHASNGRESRSSSFVPPPPPPPSHAMMMVMMQHRDSSRSSFVPPPPPPRSGFVDVQQDDARLSRTGSFRRGSLYDDHDDDDDDDRRSEMSRASFSTSRRRLSGVDRDKHGVQDSLAAILSGRKSTARRDSIDSTFRAVSATNERKSKKAAAPVPAAAAEPTITNAFAASLAAIRRNRADTMDETSGGSTPSPVKKETKNVRNRKRDTQLSAEGKELLKKAISADEPVTKSSKPQANGRKGLFDDSSSESDDSDNGLFGTGARRSSAAVTKRLEANGKPDRHSSTTPTSSHSSVDPRRTTTGRGFDDDDDGDESDSTDVSRSVNERSRFSKSRLSSPNSTASSFSGNALQQLSRVTVAYLSSIVQNEGKKPAGFFTFAFRLGALEHSFTYSYNELEAIHSRLATELKVNAFPKFPSKHRLRNNIKPENMQKRALEFVQYFQQLVAVPGILSNQRFIFEFHIDERFARSLNGEFPSEEVATTSSNPPSRKAQHAVAVSPIQKPRRSQTNGTTRTTKQLFAMDDSDSDSDASSVAPPKRVQQPRRSDPFTEGPKDEPRSKKASKLSKREFAEPAPPRGSRRPSSAASRARSESPAPVSSAPVVSAKATAPKPATAGLPPRPDIFGGGRGDLLAAIRKGAELRKTEDAAAGAANGTVSNPASSLSGPKSGPPPPPALAPGGSINDAITNAMASRRIHVEYEETHSDDDDSDDDWD